MLSCQFCLIFETAPILIDRCLVSLNLSFLGSHLYRSAIFLLVSVQFEFFRTAPILIGHLLVSLCFVWVLGLHLYRSVIHLVSISLSFWDHTHIDRSFIALSVWVQFEYLGSHLYRSVIVLLVWVWVFETVSISINHSLSCQFEFSRSHLYWSVIFLSVWVWVFLDHTYIDRSLSYQFEV